MRSVISFTFSQQKPVFRGVRWSQYFHVFTPTGLVTCPVEDCWDLDRFGLLSFEEGGLFDSSNFGVPLRDWELNPSPGI